MAKVIKTAIISAVVAVVTVVILGPAGLGVLNTAGASLTVGSLTLTGTAAVAATYAAIAFVGTAVAGGVGMLTSRGISASRGNFGTKIAGRGAQVPRQIVYGECRVGGTIVKMHTSGTKNNKLHLAIVLAGHEIESLDGVYLNDNLLTTTTTTVGGETVYRVTNAKYKNTDNEHEIDTNGTLIQYTFHDGSQTTVDGLASTNASSRYPSTAKFQGMAYVYMEIIYDPEKMPSLPPLSFRIKGKKVYDPRNSTTAYSNNPALIIRDYLVDTTYGLRALSSEINDTTAGGGFAAAANACDATVTLEDNSTTEARFTLNGFVNAASSGDGILEGFLTSCAGKLTYTNGKFNIFVGTAQTPTLTITDEDVLDTQQLSTKTGNGDLFNGIKALYVDKEQNYQGAESPLLVDSTYLAEDTPSGEQSANYKKILETQLPFTTTHQRAQRIQKIQLRRQRESATLTMLTTLEFMKLQPGDWVNVTNTRFGYSAKSFEVLSVAMEFGENDGVLYAATRLVLQEVSASVYDYVYSEYSTPQTAGSTPPGGDLSVGSPTVGTLTQRTRPEGPTAKIDIIPSWTNAAETGVQGTEIQYKESGESTYDVATIAGRGATSAVIQNVQVGKTYDVRIRHFSWDNVYGAFVDYTQVTILEPDTLSAPGNPSATTDKPFFIELTWTNPSNANFRAVEVHYSTSSGFTPSSSTLLNTYYGEPAKQKKVILGVSAGLAYDTNYYFKLRSVNVYGTTSGYTNQAQGQFKKAQNADVENLNASAITAGTIDASTVTVSNIDAGNITAGTLSVDRLDSTVVFTSNLTDGTTSISGSNIDTGTVDADRIDVSGVITAGSLLTDSATISNDIRIGSGESVFSADSNGIYLGNETFADAEFRVTPAGALTATGVTVSGAITATSGSIADSVTVGGTAASTVASNASAGNQVAEQSSLLPRADDSEWVVGDYTGKMGIWVENGSDENEVVLAEGPHGDIVKVWRATSTDGLNADGGFYNQGGDGWPIADDAVYRLSVFIKQTNDNGSFYFGAYNYSSSGSNINLYKYDGTGGDSNKYWGSGDLPTQGDWYLLVGYINPADSNISGGKGGIYKVSTGEKTNNFDDWRFSGAGSETDATKFIFRTYQYYANASPTAIMEWAHPRVDRMDRRAPSIAELLRGWTDLATPIEEGVTISGGGITLSSGGAIKGGQSAFDTGTGFFLGYESDYKFSIGNASGRKLTWNGSALEIDGNITARDLNIENATVTGTLSANNLAIDGVTLDTNASGQIIIADGGVSNDQLASASVGLGNIIAGSVSKINPVTQTGNIYRWAGYDDAGNVVNAVPSGITVEYDSTERALEIRCDGDVAVRSDTFVIDQNSIYKITAKFKKDSATGLWYIGAFQSSSALTGQVFDGGNGQTNINFTTYNASTRASGTDTNVYFDSANATTSYVEVVCYLIGANVDIDQVPQQDTLIIQAAGDAYKHVGIRILNWGNSSTTTSLFVKDLSVVEMTATTIIADNISTTNLAAINSDLGAITAGSIDIGNGDFTVSSAGVMSATGATVSGNITATSLTLSGTSIASSQLAQGVQDSLGLADSAVQDGDTGVNLGIDDGSVAGISIDSTKLYAGTGTWANSDTGFYLDNTGKFSLKDKLFFNPTNNLLTVDGNITADIITAKEGLEVLGTFTASGVAAGGITRAMLSQDALDEIFGSLATAVGGSNGDFKSASGSFTTSGGSVELGTSSDKFDHGTANVYLEFNINTYFYATTDYSTASQRQATLTFEATADGTYTDLTSATTTQVIEFGRYDLSSYYGSTYLVYYLTNSFIKILTTGTGNDLPDTTDLQFRVSVSSVGTAFTGQTIPFVFEANEGVTGVTSTGGNADTLDNLDSTAFLRSNVDDTFDGNLTITGDLILQGGIDQYNVTNLDVTDKTITVNNGGTQTLSNGAGLIVDRGSVADASILWDETNDEFDISNSVKIAGSLGVTNIVTNKVVKHNGTIFDDSNITDTGSLITLGSATTVTGNLTINSNANINLSGDLKMTGSDSYIWTPNTTTGFTGFWDPNNSRIAARYNNDDGGWGILGEPESGTELKVHGKIKATDLQVFKEVAAGGGSYETYHWNQVHAAISVHSASNTYVILNTAVPQDNYSMGGFTLICFNEYNDESEGDVIHIYGYWNPESNGGFVGFRYVCSNPDFEPTIQVGRNSSGNTAFLISGFDNTSYTVMVARDLYLGYLANNAAASWGDGWTFSQASATTGYSYLNTLTRVGITDTQVANWNTAYTYSQVGHLPLSGGTISGSLTAGNTIVGDQSDISMDASANGQLEIRGNGYTGAIALNSSDMHLYHNSSERGIVFGTNEANRVRITSSGNLETYYDLNSYAAHKYYVSTSDSAHQRADARDEGGTLSRLHWYGVTDSGGTSNFRHAWYDGNSYINVTANGDKITFDHSTSPISLALASTNTSSNPVFMTLEGRNSSNQQFLLEIANRGNHTSASFRDKIDFSVNNNGTYYYSALRFDLYGGVETKQHIGNAASPYAGDDRYFKFTNDTASASGTLVTADNGNTWLNADGGKDLWLNWYSLNNPASHANLQVGDGDGNGAVLSVIGVDRRVGILNASPSYPLDVAGDIRGTGTVRADSGINVHSGRISTTSSNQTGGGNVETYYQPDGNNNHTWRLIAGGTNTGYGTGAGGLGFFYQSSGGGNPDYNLILRANQTSRFGGKVDIEHTNLGAEPYVGLLVKNTSTTGDRLTGIAVDATWQSHYRYMLGGVTKWQTRVGAGGATDDWRLYSFTTASDILTVKPSGEGQLRLFKEGSSTQWTDTSGTGSISISGYGGQSSGSNPTVAFSAGNGGYAMFYLNRLISGSETFSDSSARYFDFYRAGASKVRMVTSAADEFGFYMAGSGSFNVWNSGGTNTVNGNNSGTTTLYALNVSNSAQVGGSNIFHAGYSNTWAQIPAGTRTDYTLKFKPAVNNFAGFDFRDPDNNNAGYLLIKGTSNTNPTYRANGITLVCDTGDVSIVQRTTTDKAIRFVTNNTTDFAERGRFAASGNFLVGTTAEGGLNNSEGSIRAAGNIDTGVGDKAAFRLYDGTTFKGGFGSSWWATGASSNSHVAILTSANRSLEIYTGGVTSASRMTIEADGTIDNPSAKWARTYHQVDAYASGGSANDVHTHWGVLCAGSHNGTPSAYTIIETNIDQDAYRMGGFTILLMDKYNDDKTRARIDLAGYWNPESNGGFIGWGYTTTNTRERPTIYVMRNSSTGKVAFAYQHSAVVGASYPVILACDLWIGYSGSAEADGKNWSIKQAANLNAYTNTDQVNHVGGNGNYQNNDGSFVISKSSGTMFSHGSFSDAIGYNPSYGTYVGAGGRYVYSGTASAGNSGSHPYYSSGSGVYNITHDGGQIANTYNGDHTFTNTTSSGGIKVSNNQSGGPAIKIHSTNTNGTDWWLISNSSSNTDGAGKLQLWSNNNSFTAATFGETNQDITSIYTPTRVIAQNAMPNFTTHTTGNTAPTLVANAAGYGAHGLVVNQPNGGYWSQIISTQRYGLNIDSHSSDSGTYLLAAAIAGINQFWVRGDGVVHHRTTTLHGVSGGVAGNAYYYADANNGANIDYYSPNGAQAHMDCRNDGNHSKLHKYTYVAAYGYGSYKEAWWDGNSYHEIGSISDAIRTNGDFVASGNVTAYGSYSDRRLKENIRPFENARELIKDIDVHRFNYIGKDDDLIGVIAQEVEETLPQLVYELIDTDSNEVRKAVRYDHLSAVLLKVVKEQDEEIQELKALVHSLLEKIK